MERERPRILAHPRNRTIPSGDYLHGSHYPPYPEGVEGERVGNSAEERKLRWLEQDSTRPSPVRKEARPPDFALSLRSRCGFHDECDSQRPRTSGVCDPGFAHARATRRNPENSA